jgi:hypothetical protein
VHVVTASVYINLSTSCATCTYLKVHVVTASVCIVVLYLPPMQHISIKQAESECGHGQCLHQHFGSPCATYASIKCLLKALY